MLIPKRYEHKHVHKGRNRGDAKRGDYVAFGTFGLQSLENARITSRQLEAARVALSRKAKRGGKVWVRVFPFRPFSKKPLETRMGKGKGNIEGWEAIVKKGTILYEVDGIDEASAREAMKLAGAKLPVLTRFVKRGES